MMMKNSKNDIKKMCDDLFVHVHDDPYHLFQYYYLNIIFFSTSYFIIKIITLMLMYFNNFHLLFVLASIQVHRHNLKFISQKKRNAPIFFHSAFFFFFFLPQF